MNIYATNYLVFEGLEMVGVFYLNIVDKEYFEKLGYRFEAC